MKSLVIAEKPSVGRDIARVLHCTKNLGKALEGEKYIVTWGLGHLVTLADPEGYSPDYKQWKMEDLPIMPSPFKLEVIGQTAGQYKAVKEQLHRKDIKDVIIATDAGREGELVARWILLKAGNDKPVKRLWISSVTDKAIREGFSGLKDGREYDRLYEAAASRAEADWLVGINATRALTCKYNAQLSCGRVQTPTLSMIARREEEIRDFKPREYFGLVLRDKKTGVSFVWEDKGGNTKTFQKEKVEELRSRLSGMPARVEKVIKKPKKTYSPALYDLTELQREANRRFGYSPKQTLDIMQRLYENHKVLTYPRTDSRYLTTDIAGTLRERLSACAVGPYRRLAAPLLKKTFTGKESFFDNSRVGDHHAIIPTEEFVQLDHMTHEERNIYDLVVRRFLAVMYPPCEYQQTQVILNCGQERFTAVGRVQKEPGFTAVYGDDYEEEDQENPVSGTTIPEFCEGDILSDLSAEITAGKTKPPAYFTEATLLSAMENPAAFLESKDQKTLKTLKETGGLGTVATRADIIEKLFSSFLIEKKGNELHTTSKARQLLELVPEDLRKPELTADWERKLSLIAEGKLKRKTFMEDIREYTVDVMDEIRKGEGTFRHDNLTNRKCPNCGKRLLRVKGKKSEMLVCQDRECGYRETVAQTSNARCPVCHKKMELRGKDEGRIFVCACGYKEKLSAFKERREKEGKGVSKKDVAAYMRKQQKEAAQPVNSMASLFSNIKLDP